jgi:hypothetical protein
MAEPDANEKALRLVEKATGSTPVGEDEELLASPELQRQWREAKERLRKPSGEQPVK